MRDLDTGKSESRSVMGWVRVKDLPDPKGCRHPVGAPIAKTLKELHEGRKANEHSFGQCMHLLPKGNVAVK